VLTQTEGGPKFRGLEGQKLNQNLINNHFFLIAKWGQAVQLIIYEEFKEEHVRRATCLALSQVKKKKREGH
jgi:hypothetical protein